MIINIPLTEERRKELVKKSKAEGEDTKVGIRSARRDAMEISKKPLRTGIRKTSESAVKKRWKKMTKEFVEKVDQLISSKEKDITLTI